MDKYDYIENIITYIRGMTGINYQTAIKEILTVYYECMGKKYEMPRHYGGDKKNDGWVEEDKVFYQIFAPVDIRSTLKKEIQKKFEEDLNGLLKIIYEEGGWGGEIKQFVFLVNTMDTELPQDSERFFDKTVDKFKEKYNINFDYIVSNNNYIRSLLENINTRYEDNLTKILSRLRIKDSLKINYESITSKAILDLIINISNNLSKKYIFKDEGTSYIRVSAPQKIDINNLTSIKEEIESIICILDVVDEAIYIINQDISSENMFERVKNFVIAKYDELSNNLIGVDLYRELNKELLKYLDNNWNFEPLGKVLITYIFDKCDIFKKE